MRKRLISVAATLGILAPLPTGAGGAVAPAVATARPEAEQPEPDAGYVFGLLDRDGDGRIDGTEAKASAPLVKYFGDIDTDADGRISRDEWGSYFRPGFRA